VELRLAARGWPAGRELPSASARALYVLFLIAEVHPFNDGNGRISRLGMNAELEASGQHLRQMRF
jgi:fido (protein-threonine AMPylation protein)